MNRKCARRLMRIEATYQKPNTSRRVLAWRLSTGMETEFCVEAVQEALDRHRPSKIFNTDQGVRFTGDAFIGVLAASSVRISPVASLLGMDGKGHYLDTICGYVDNASTLPTYPKEHHQQEKYSIDYQKAL